MVRWCLPPHLIPHCLVKMFLHHPARHATDPIHTYMVACPYNASVPLLSPLPNDAHTQNPASPELPTQSTTDPPLPTSKGPVKIMAKDLVRTRAQVTKFYQMKCQMQAVGLRLQTIKSTQVLQTSCTHTRSPSQPQGPSWVMGEGSSGK